MTRHKHWAIFLFPIKWYIMKIMKIESIIVSLWKYECVYSMTKKAEMVS